MAWELEKAPLLSKVVGISGRLKHADLTPLALPSFPVIGLPEKKEKKMGFCF